MANLNPEDPRGETFEARLRTELDEPRLMKLAQTLRAAAGGGRPAAEPAETAAAFEPVGPNADTIRRLARDPAFRREVAATARVLYSLAQGRRRSARWWVIGTALAAGLALIAAVPPAFRPDTEPHRAGAAEPAAPRIEAISAESRTPLITWTATPGADRYVLELTLDDGGLVFTAETPETTFALPDSVVVPATTYFVRIRARVAAGRWVSSAFQDLVVQP